MSDGQCEVLPYANIRIINKSDSIFLCGGVSDANGFFKLNFDIQQGKEYYISISYIGMKTFSKELDSFSLIENIGDIKMLDGVELGEVTVIGELSPIEQKGDTTVINSSTYRLAPGSYLEELIKRIPGLEYDYRSGQLLYNGKYISEIKVNGETFFSGNTQMALENLPVEFVEKIKIYKNNGIGKITNIGIQKSNFVLDIQTPAKFDGAFISSSSIGYGNREKKKIDLLGNYFRKNGDNVSIVGKLNNLDLFTDYKDNIQNILGINIVKKTGDFFTINGNIMYNRKKIGSESTFYNEQYLANNNQYTYSENFNLSDNRIFSTNFGFTWNVNSKTIFNIRSGYSKTLGSSGSDGKQGTLNEKIDVDIKEPFASWNDISESKKINEGVSQSLIKNKQRQYMVNAQLTRLLGEDGGSISFVMDYFKGCGENKNFALSSIDYYKNNNSKSVDYTNKYILNPMMNKNATIGICFDYPLSKRIQMQLSYNMKYKKTVNNREMYDLSTFENSNLDFGILPEQYATGYIDSLSNYANSKNIGNELGFCLEYSKSKWNVVVGVLVEPEQRSINQERGAFASDTVANCINWTPQLSVLWQNKYNLFRLSYRGNTLQPALLDLISTEDNTNPLFIIKGNPSLKSSYVQTVQLEAQNTKYGLFLYWDMQHYFNRQVHSIIYNQGTGGQVSIPKNVNGNWNTNLKIDYQRKIKKINVSLKSKYSFYQDVNLLFENNSQINSQTKTIEVGEEINISYHPKWGNIDLKGSWIYQKSRNKVYQERLYINEFNLGLYGHVNLPYNIQLKNDISYFFRKGNKISSDIGYQCLWNMEVIWRFMKKKQAEISLYCGDILDERKKYNINITAINLSEDYTKQIGRYFLISLKYNFSINK